MPCMTSDHVTTGIQIAHFIRTESDAIAQIIVSKRFDRMFVGKCPLLSVRCIYELTRDEEPAGEAVLLEQGGDMGCMRAETVIEGHQQTRAIDFPTTLKQRVVF